MIEWLTGHKNVFNGYTVYSLDEAKEKYEVRTLTDDSYLVLNRNRFGNNENWLDFAVLEFSYSDVDSTNVFLSCVFNGGGPTDILRECRHTWWGEDGYVFYPKIEIITEGLKALEEFFDMD